MAQNDKMNGAIVPLWFAKTSLCVLLVHVEKRQPPVHTIPVVASSMGSIIMKFTASAIIWVYRNIHQSKNTCCCMIMSRISWHHEAQHAEASTTVVICDLSLLFDCCVCSCCLMVVAAVTVIVFIHWLSSIWSLMLEMAKDGFHCWDVSIMSHHHFYITLYSMDIIWQQVLNLWIISIVNVLAALSLLAEQRKFRISATACWTSHNTSYLSAWVRKHDYSCSDIIFPHLHNHVWLTRNLSSYREI